MKTELIIFISSDFKNELTLNNLSHLTLPVDINYTFEHAKFVIRLASTLEELNQITKNRLFDERESSCIVLSDNLIDYDENSHAPIPSKISLSIFEYIRQSSSQCGLIALTEVETPHVTGIDSNVTMDKSSLNALRSELEKISTRLWYKKPPINMYQHNVEHLFSVEIVPVPNFKALKNCLKLRSQVYSALGYIDETSTIEMDAYDLTAIHFIAVDRANKNRIAGTMRLIIPGAHALPVIPEGYNNLNNYERWFRDIARVNTDKPWRRLFDRRQPTALPVLGAFTYFDTANEEIEIDESLMPNNICELSRVVVAPEYRGMGISNSLINHAISVAKKFRRNFLWIECAPHHINMYQKYGFIAKEHDGRLFYDRAQRLDTWAVAMYLGLSKTQRIKTQENTVCYRLQVSREDQENKENCSLLFRFNQQSAAHVEQAFNSAINDMPIDATLSVRGVSMPLKKLIPSTLSCLDIKNFLICLEALMNKTNIDRLSIQHCTGRSYSFNPEDILSNKRNAIESRLQQWFR